MPKEDVFTAMIKEEIKQYEHYFLNHDPTKLQEENFRKIAKGSLRKTRILGGFVIFAIIVFSVISFFHFIQYGNTGNRINLWLGIGSWLFVIISTIYYARDIIEKKKSMERILKLLEAREDYYRSRERKNKTNSAG